MALTNCKECGHKISKKAEACPSCGAPQKAKKKRAGCGTTVILIFLLGLLILSLNKSPSPSRSNVSQPSNTPEQMAARREKHRADLEKELATNRDAIIANVETLIEDGEFSEALKEASRFSGLQDEALVRLENDARIGAFAEEEQRILAKLKTIPASDHDANIAEYARLVEMFPQNKTFSDKLAYYKNAKKEAETEATAARNERIQKYGEPPTQSAWDGSYYEVERYLESVANDPDSIEIDTCTGVYRNDDGWLVGCDYRGRNAFGGMIRKSNWFLIRHGRVVKMADADQYSVNN